MSTTAVERMPLAGRFPIEPSLTSMVRTIRKTRAEKEPGEGRQVEFKFRMLLHGETRTSAGGYASFQRKAGGTSAFFLHVLVLAGMSDVLLLTSPMTPVGARQHISSSVSDDGLIEDAEGQRVRNFAAVKVSRCRTVHG